MRTAGCACARTPRCCPTASPGHLRGRREGAGGGDHPARRRRTLWLVEQYRHPVGDALLELPQGAWDDRPDAPAEELARGELAEETGLRAGRMERLGRMFFAYGISDQRFDVWLAHRA